MYVLLKKFIIKFLNKQKNQINTGHIPLNVAINNIGVNCLINNEVHIMKKDVEIGDYTYINGGYIFFAKIGKFCSIAFDVCLGPGEHHIDRVSTFPLKNRVCDINNFSEDFPEPKYCIIGNDVWIGTKVTILQGVKIGNGAIIASGAVVTKDVEPYSIVGGVPAKLMKYRFSKDIIEKLQVIQWWNWEHERIKKVALNNEFKDINTFVEKYYKLML